MNEGDYRAYVQLCRDRPDSWLYTEAAIQRSVANAATIDGIAWLYREASDRVVVAERELERRQKEKEDWIVRHQRIG